MFGWFMVGWLVGRPRRCRACRRHDLPARPLGPRPSWSPILWRVSMVLCVGVIVAVYVKAAVGW